jgi:hypothetical protein
MHSDGVQEFGSVRYFPIISLTIIISSNTFRSFDDKISMCAQEIYIFW